MQSISQKRRIIVRAKQLIRNFSDDSGATTVEFVLWVPVFMFILMITELCPKVGDGMIRRRFEVA